MVARSAANIFFQALLLECFVLLHQCRIKTTNEYIVILTRQKVWSGGSLEKKGKESWEMAELLSLLLFDLFFLRPNDVDELPRDISREL